MTFIYFISLQHQLQNNYYFYIITLMQIVIEFNGDRETEDVNLRYTYS